MAKVPFIDVTSGTAAQKSEATKPAAKKPAVSQRLNKGALGKKLQAMFGHRLDHMSCAAEVVGANVATSAVAGFAEKLRPGRGLKIWKIDMRYPLGIGLALGGFWPKKAVNTHLLSTGLGVLTSATSQAGFGAGGWAGEKWTTWRTPKVAAGVEGIGDLRRAHGRTYLSDQKGNFRTGEIEMDESDDDTYLENAELVGMMDESGSVLSALTFGAVKTKREALAHVRKALQRRINSGKNTDTGRTAHLLKKEHELSKKFNEQPVFVKQGNVVIDRLAEGKSAQMATKGPPWRRRQHRGQEQEQEV